MSQQTILNYYMSNKASKPREFDDFEGMKGGKRKSSDVDHETEESYDFEVPKKQHLSVVGTQNFPLTPILRSVGLRTKTFHDRIYGQIELDPLIIRIMDTKQFQRLQQLKQLGLCENVFRSANHTRFEHSVGAMHLATRMMQTLEEQRRKDKKLRRMFPAINQYWENLREQKGYPALPSKRNEDGSCTYSIPAKITEADKLCVKVAALCHDLGHGPFSHMFETMICQDMGLDWAHEEMSVLMLKYLLRDNNIRLEDYGLDPVNDLRFIEELIVGDDLDGGKRNGGGIEARRGRGPEKNFLYDIINNAHSGLDIDKLDYFMRDKKVSLGEEDKQPYRFIDLARVCWCPELDKDEKLAPEAMEIFKIRFNMHWKVYTHRNVKAVEYLIRDVLKLAFKHYTVPCYDKDTARLVRRVPIEEAIYDPAAFVNLDDHILSNIYNFQSEDEDMQCARALLHRYQRHDFYKFVGNTPMNFVDARHGGNSVSADSQTDSHPIKTSVDALKQEMLSLWEEENVCIPDTPDEQNSDVEYPLDDRGSQPMNEEFLSQSRTPVKGGNQNAPSAGQLSADDLIVEKWSVHHGKKSKNPVDEVFFFSSEKEASVKGLWVARRVSQNRYGSILPRDQIMHGVRVFCKEPSKRHAAISAHRLWCKKKMWPESLGTDSMHHTNDSH
ncbi:hypothetical protein GUITHDRAFT_117108 [Guillardia theta CCMP2712]|uniref:HD/PDEase domain-containing protein n=1 Tax=Guillardia theta (strain CCMP2712) TaxID=905079 RepID=L1IKA8_GUITC|nr:hypothetical protein GUITHDRAFT_117108 [Guillardia theta CCMP2712]EKX36683.1 hypothetical protein GUITHDRAFT_117108 [Guillardia theta CCMP2712]|eukprot:XP_005823663.1 hypothetical protein GUITHDRAFT_117108 [Guillardia theta CCMP2712]